MTIAKPLTLSASGVAGKSKEPSAASGKARPGNPNAVKRLYATVSCQLLRPHVRATLFCEGVRCAMKAQQRNIKHTQFDAWDSRSRWPDTRGDGSKIFGGGEGIRDNPLRIAPQQKLLPQFSPVRNPLVFRGKTASSSLGGAAQTQSPPRASTIGLCSFCCWDYLGFWSQ